MDGTLEVCYSGSSREWCASNTDETIAQVLCSNASLFEDVNIVLFYAISPTRFLTFPECLLPFIQSARSISIYNMRMVASSSLDINPLMRFGGGLLGLIVDNSFVTTSTGELCPTNLDDMFIQYPSLYSLTITNTFLNTSLFHSAPANLISLTLTNTSITGTISSSIASNVSSTSIQWNLSNNKISGPLPSQFDLGPSDLATIRPPLLDLSKNNLTGTVPPSFLSSITSSTLRTPGLTFSLADNHLSGTFTLTELTGRRSTYGTRFNIANNDFSGLSIHSSWSNAIFSLDVSSNPYLVMSENLPDGLFNSSSLLRYLNLSHTHLAGVLPNMGVLGAPKIASLDLGCALDLDLCSGSNRSAWTPPTLTQCVLAPSAIECPSLYPSICSISNCTYYAVPEEDPISEPIDEPVAVPATPDTTPAGFPTSTPASPDEIPGSPIPPSLVGTIPSEPSDTPSPVSASPSQTAEPTNAGSSLRFGSQTVILLIGMFGLLWVLL